MLSSSHAWFLEKTETFGGETCPRRAEAACDFLENLNEKTTDFKFSSQ